MSFARRLLCVAATATAAGVLGVGATGVAGAAGSDHACTTLEGTPPGALISYIAQVFGNNGQNNPGAPPGTGPPIVAQFCNPHGLPPEPGS
jgi:hypothetical protein